MIPSGPDGFLAWTVQLGRTRVVPSYLLVNVRSDVSERL